MHLEGVYVLRRLDERRPGTSPKVPKVCAVFTVTKGNTVPIASGRKYFAHLWLEGGGVGRPFHHWRVCEYRGEELLKLFIGCLEAAYTTLGREKNAALKKNILKFGADILGTEGDFMTIMDAKKYHPEKIV